jgi:hypothetical protein
LGTTESFDGVAALPIFSAGGESSTVQDKVPESNSALADNDNAINALIIITELLDVDSKPRKRKADDQIVPWNKDFRLRKKIEGGGGGVGGGGSGRYGGGGGKCKEKEEEKVEEDEFSCHGESDRKDNADSDKEEHAPSKDNLLHLLETLNDKLDGSESLFSDDDEESVKSGLELPPFFQIMILAKRSRMRTQKGSRSLRRKRVQALSLISMIGLKC